VVKEKVDPKSGKPEVPPEEFTKEEAQERLESLEAGQEQIVASLTEIDKRLKAIEELAEKAKAKGISNGWW
jgi:chaperonin cofactor prefoldin